MTVERWLCVALANLLLNQQSYGLETLPRWRATCSPIPRHGTAHSRGEHPQSSPVVVGPNGSRQRTPTYRLARSPSGTAVGKSHAPRAQVSDAQALWAFINSDEVTRFLSPPPPTVEGFERFIAWTHRQRAVGMQADLRRRRRRIRHPVGLFQLRQLEPGFGTAEWGFAIGSAFWGTGVFRTGAELMMHLAFDIIGVHRLEARACLHERPRERGAQKRSARSRKACSGARSCARANISIRCCGRFSKKTGGRPK